MTPFNEKKLFFSEVELLLRAKPASKLFAFVGALFLGEGVRKRFIISILKL